MKKIQLALFTFLAVFGLTFGGLGTSDYAYAVQPATGGTGTGNATSCVAASGTIGTTSTDIATDCTESDALKKKLITFVKIFASLGVVFSVGMIIYGGFKYITSQGEPRATETAKTQIWYAGVGLFIIIAAFTILQLFLSASRG